MTLNYRFLVLLAVFEIAFGLAVFAVTRQYYLDRAEPVSARPAVRSEALPARSNNITEADLARFNLSVPSPSVADDPVEISRLANEFFVSRQYDRAAELYERLLPFGPNNAETYNNLGLTLHYLGRSTEALSRLNEGITVDPAHQRTWLTLGFVNSQVGNTEQAREALTNAIEIGTDDEIRKSATKMLESLP